MSNDAVEVELQQADEIDQGLEMSNDAVEVQLELVPRAQPQGGSHEVQPLGGSHEILLDDSHELLLEIESRLQNRDISHATRPSMDSNSSNSSKSEELPSIIGNWKSWDGDFGISFFPETQMWQLAACITHWFGVDLSSYCGYMQDNVDLAWSYYLGVNEQFRAENRNRFIQHLLVNSCFLIFAMILISVQKDPVGKRNQKYLLDEKISRGDLPMGLRRKDIKNIINLLFQDPKKVQLYMLTMNHQIPWFVLEAIYEDLSSIGTLLGTSILKFALSCFPTHSIIHASKDDHDEPAGGFKHLLHIFHWSRNPNGDYLANNLATTKWINQFYIPSATDLQLSLTSFKKYPKGSFHVSYSDNGIFSGEMQLTPWYLSQPNTTIYESLLSFEQVYGASCGFSFTAYVTCMACLLTTENDVRVLRENGIIPSTRFGDNDVLFCVQQLRTVILDNLKIPDELKNLEEKVMTRYERSAYRVCGDFKRRYCSNTWITISVIGAILISGFTIIQTIYAVLGHYKKN